MIKFKEMLDQVGYFQLGTRPTFKTEWLAYSNGECKIFDTVADARKFSHLFEPRVTNIKEIIDFDIAANKLQEDANTLFMIHARKNIGAHLTIKMWDICWGKAYEEEHTNGMDAVAKRMVEVIRFANKVIEAVENPI